MTMLRRNEDRRHIQRCRRETWHTFYRRDCPDPLASGFRSLVLFDEMRLRPGEAGLPHLRDEAEVVTYVYRGALAQQESDGRSGVIRAGEFQRMTSGRDIRHMEANASPTDSAHLFRLFLWPSATSTNRAFEQKRFSAAQRRNVLCPVASSDGRNGSLRTQQDVVIYSSVLDPGSHLVHELLPGRSAWVHIVNGEATLNDIVLTRGDGVGVTAGPAVSLTGVEDTELLLVDVGSAPCVHSDAERSDERTTAEAAEGGGRTNRRALEESKT